METYDDINIKNVMIIKESDIEYEISNAINELFNNNKGIIMSLINKYKYFIKDESDVINEAYYILWECAKNFDLKSNNRFATYFYNSFSNTILKMINDEVIVSQYIKKKIKIVDDFVAEYSLKNNVEPSVEIISNGTGISIEKIKEYLFYSEYQVANSSDEIVDLTDTVSIENTLIEEYESKRFKDVFSRLSEKERYILIRKYGLDGKPTEDFKKIGKKYNQTGENIRVIHNNALKKLKSQLGGLKNEK